MASPGGSTLPGSCRNHRDQRGDLGICGIAPNDAKHRPPLVVLHASLHAI
jgi:hypothetical protein